MGRTLRKALVVFVIVQTLLVGGWMMFFGAMLLREHLRSVARTLVVEEIPPRPEKVWI